MKYVFRPEEGVNTLATFNISIYSTPKEAILGNSTDGSLYSRILRINFFGRRQFNFFFFISVRERCNYSSIGNVVGFNNGYRQIITFVWGFDSMYYLGRDREKYYPGMIFSKWNAFWFFKWNFLCLNHDWSDILFLLLQFSASFTMQILQPKCFHKFSSLST